MQSSESAKKAPTCRRTRDDDLLKFFARRARAARATRRETSRIRHGSLATLTSSRTISSCFPSLDPGWLCTLSTGHALFCACSRGQQQQLSSPALGIRCSHRCHTAAAGTLLLLPGFVQLGRQVYPQHQCGALLPALARELVAPRFIPKEDRCTAPFASRLTSLFLVQWNEVNRISTPSFGTLATPLSSKKCHPILFFKRSF